MKTIIRGKEHKVVFITYHNRKVHDVITDQDGCHYSWDAFYDQGSLYLYNAGVGGGNKMDAPKYIKGAKNVRLWLNGLELVGEPENCKIIKNPILLKCPYSGKSYNPFTIGDITHSYEYCEECGERSIEICREHVHEVEDEEGNYEFRYISTGQLYE